MAKPLKDIIEFPGDRRGVFMSNNACFEIYHRSYCIATAGFLASQASSTTIQKGSFLLDTQTRSQA
jgi:hypothetical protein